jgi:hypothetical protein
MDKKLLLVVCILLFGAGQAAAQNPPDTPLPKVIWLYHEVVKPAQGTVHEKVENGFAKYWSKAPVTPFLGMESLTSTSETLFVSGYNSFGSFEKDFQVFRDAANGPRKVELGLLQRQEADLINSMRSTVAVLQDELSYMTDRLMSDLPRSRYFQVLTMKVAPGKEEDFAAVAKFYRSAFERGDYEQPFATYKVMFGGLGTTYLVFLPLKSLSAIDTAMVKEPQLLKAMGEEGMKNMMKNAEACVISEENNLYAFNPKISLVAKEFAAVDPEFWASGPKAGGTMAASPTSSRK